MEKNEKRQTAPFEKLSDYPTFSELHQFEAALALTIIFLDLLVYQLNEGWY